MQTRIVDFVVSHSNIDEGKFRELLMKTDQIATDIGSIVDGKEAVNIGLIDSMGGISDALSELRSMIQNK